MPSDHGSRVATQLDELRDVVGEIDALAALALCVRASRLPDDLPALAARLQGGEDVLCAICAGQLADRMPSLILPAPLFVPPVAQRSAELDRIIAEYAADATAELAAPPSSFTADDHAWVRDQAAASLAEIETATLRLVAIRISHNLSGAATLSPPASAGTRSTGVTGIQGPTRWRADGSSPRRCRGGTRMISSSRCEPSEAEEHVVLA